MSEAEMDFFKKVEKVNVKIESVKTGLKKKTILNFFIVGSLAFFSICGVIDVTSDLLSGDSKVVQKVEKIEVKPQEKYEGGFMVSSVIVNRINAARALTDADMTAMYKKIDVVEKEYLEELVKAYLKAEYVINKKSNNSSKAEKLKELRDLVRKDFKTTQIFFAEIRKSNRLNYGFIKSGATDGFHKTFSTVEGFQNKDGLETLITWANAAEKEKISEFKADLPEAVLRMGNDDFSIEMRDEIEKYVEDNKGKKNSLPF